MKNKKLKNDFTSENWANPPASWKPKAKFRSTHYKNVRIRQIVKNIRAAKNRLKIRCTRDEASSSCEFYLKYFWHHIMKKCHRHQQLCEMKNYQQFCHGAENEENILKLKKEIVAFRQVDMFVCSWFTMMIYWPELMFLDCQGCVFSNQTK